MYGPQVDDGTAFEIGWFYATKPKNPIAGVRSDVRFGGGMPYAKIIAMLEDTVKEVSGRFFVDMEDVLSSLNELVRLLP